MATTTEEQFNNLLAQYREGTPDGSASSARGTGDFNTHSAAPNAMAISQALGLDPAVGQMAVSGLGSLLGPAGMALGALNTVGNVVNTNANTAMLNGLGTSPSALQSLGGAMGRNPLAGNYTGALSMAMGDRMPGFQGIEIAQAPGDYGAGYADPGNTAVGGVMAGYGPGDVTSENLGAPAGYEGGGGGGQSSGSDNGNQANDNSGGADPGGAASEAGFAHGGLVEGNRLARSGRTFTGLVHGSTPGQADDRSVTLARGSYVAPAQAVAAVGQGNTMAGAKALDAGAKAPTSADPVRADVSDGEFVIDPARVLAIGGGDMKVGASRLDHLFALIRQHGIEGMIPDGKPFVLENLFVRKSA